MERWNRTVVRDLPCFVSTGKWTRMRTWRWPLSRTIRESVKQLVWRPIGQCLVSTHSKRKGDLDVDRDPGEPEHLPSGLARLHKVLTGYNAGAGCFFGQLKSSPTKEKRW